ncbi:MULTISPECIES: dipeptidase PepE [unclassified Brenneria]|uniref:dipeptidase PepE n=1 Tax=unclassified Brenneria TaxID=2634434 RepID=UPI0029C1D355|nr:MULTISPECIES: dipeptidase PepE [unclassified Brenneria]MDX5626545.1 dipeptidase PepE [Brenneria sp. L3-3Z]MDX5694105.1 dipeptidase PepE [Brenneria sp. L4-2C]
MQLLLLSNSSLPGQGYLQHAQDAIRAAVKTRKHALFIPFAGVTISWDDYTKKVRQALSAIDIAITPIHTAADPRQAVINADIIIVGGGNTFNLLKCCRERGLLTAIRQRVQQGAAYIGWSAGANLACPTICTTNDMPITDPQGFDALRLIDFQINPHYTNQLPVGHQGETRNQRLAELLIAQPDITIVGLPEGDWLTVDDKRIRLDGPHPATLFRAQQAPETLDCGEIRLS